MKNLVFKSANRVLGRAALFLLAILVTNVSYGFDFPEAGNFSDGSKAWSENCARCHNMRNPTDLRDDQWITSVFHMRGRAGLTGQETRDILTFLQGSNARVKRVEGGAVKLTETASDDISAKHIYESNCIACHGANGKSSIPGTPDLTAQNGRLAKSDAELLGNIINGFQTPGNSMQMPPRGGNAQLSDADLVAVLKYVKASFYK